MVYFANNANDQLKYIFLGALSYSSNFVLENKISLKSLFCSSIFIYLKLFPSKVIVLGQLSIRKLGEPKIKDKLLSCLCE